MVSSLYSMSYVGSPVLHEPSQSLKLVPVRVSTRSLTLQDDDIVMTWVWNTCIGVVYIIISSFFVVVRHYCHVPYIHTRNCFDYLLKAGRKLLLLLSEKRDKRADGRRFAASGRGCEQEVALDHLFISGFWLLAYMAGRFLDKHEGVPGSVWTHSTV